VLLAADATEQAWVARIQELAAARNVVALQAIAEARPGADQGTRARLLAETTKALGAIGQPARLAFDDLLAASHRDLRMAAMNAFAFAFPAERQEVLTRLQADRDPVIQAKAEALMAVFR